MIVNISNMHDPENIGDRMCSPLTYFDFPGELRVISYAEAAERMELLRSASMVIVGGGGAGWWHYDLSEVFHHSGHTKLVGWGFGCNTHGITRATYPAGMEKFRLLGIRDWPADRFPWVPCVSCMHRDFERVYKKCHDVVVYSHATQPILQDSPWPTMSNDTSDIRLVLEHLGSARTVVTNTYHGAYWAHLLNCKVVIYKPFSSRFYHLRWPAVIVEDDEHLPLAIESATVSQQALGEARSVTRAFYKRVFDVYRES